MDTRGATPLGGHGLPGDPEPPEPRFEAGRGWAPDEPAQRRGPCPDSETLAAFVDDRLDAPQRAVVAAHVAHCDDCLFVVGESERFRDAETRVPPPQPARRAPARARAIAAAVLTGALILAALLLSWC